MTAIQKFIVSVLEYACVVLDRVPAYSDGRLFLMGGWGCRIGLSDLASRLDERWQTGVWEPVETK